MGILQLLDELPDAITRTPPRLWSVLARSLGEQGANGRTALAWRWALTGTCPSPVTLTMAIGRPPSRAEILGEASAPAELASSAADPSGQVVQARFALEWISGKIDALPLWNGGSEELPVTDGADFPRIRPEIEAAYFWGLLAQQRYPWRDPSAPADSRLAFGWACGVMDLMAWVCGEASEGPLSSRRVFGRPTLYEVSLDACRGMTGVRLAREVGDPVRARRIETDMQTFLWLAGWSQLPPVDRHGHGSFENCPDREAPCGCDAAGQCLGADCRACGRYPCIYAFGQEIPSRAAPAADRPAAETGLAAEMYRTPHGQDEPASGGPGSA